MITISNVKQYINVPFAEYQKLPGKSTSFLKQEVQGIKPDFVMTDKVMVGSLVDAILTEPRKANMADPLYPFARSIAFCLKERFGDMMTSFKPQVSYTGTLKMCDWTLQVRGRLDYLLPLLAVVDLKVTYATNIPALIEFMKYKEQMHLYCKFAGVTKAYLFVYCVPKKTCSVHFIDCSTHSTWWEEKIINFGTIE